MLLVNIGFDPSYTSEGSGKPVLQVSDMRALVDTGASECFIDNSLAMALHLPIVDRLTISTVQGMTDVNSYLAQLHVPSLNKVIEGEFAGIHIQPAMRPFSALIGRSFLREFTMTYEGRTGRVTLSDE